MDEHDKGSLPQLWARLRFSVVGQLLASPPARGRLKQALHELAERTWRHPVTGEAIQFAVRTIERWFYTARRDPDPVHALRREPRRDRGRWRALTPQQQQALRNQHAAHPSWSYQLHSDNLAVVVEDDASLGAMPSYATVRRFMNAAGLLKRRRIKGRRRPGEQAAAARLEEREVRSYENEHVNGLWHSDCHHGSLPVLTASGEWCRPIVVGVLDDHSRLACHVQWYLAEEDARTFVHGLSQAFQKRALPRALLTDNGSAMLAGETVEGLARLGVIHETTLAYSPYQNGKQENFWAQLEGRLVAMLEGCRELSLELLNEATQAWCELEYNREIHSEIGVPPAQRYAEGSDVGRECPDSDALRLAFCLQTTRTQRHSDGTISLQGRRFEVPGRFRHLRRITVRYARWDLSHVRMIDPVSDKVLDRLYPLDKTRNADGRRRRLGTPANPEAAEAHEPSGELAPLLKRLLAEYAATGLPPAYLPPERNDDPGEEEDD